MRCIVTWVCLQMREPRRTHAKPQAEPADVQQIQDAFRRHGKQEQGSWGVGQRDFNRNVRACPAGLSEDGYDLLDECDNQVSLVNGWDWSCRG